MMRIFSLPSRVRAKQMILAACAALSALATYATPAAHAQVNITTYHNDNGRTGLNPNETVLTPSNVNANSFGLLFTQPVDGYVYAQPLYLSGVTMPDGSKHNVVYVATEHDSVYCFDADSNQGADAQPLWVTSLGPSVPNPDVGSWDLVPEIGITSTPVIDLSTQAIYVLAKTKELDSSGNVIYVQRLHALSLTTGHEIANSPVVIRASVPGTGDGNNGNGYVPFDPLTEHNRPALLLSGNTIYIGWASHGDNGPYHGWVMGYNDSTLAQTAVLNLTPNSGLGGIWQSGDGLAGDSNGNVFAATGNGGFDGSSDFGDSVVRMAPVFSKGGGGPFVVKDYFTPSNQYTLAEYDEDLGSGGVLLLPRTAGSLAHPDLMISVGKQGTIYLIDRDNMGHYNGMTDTMVQEVAGQIGGVWGSPAYFNGSVYFGGVGDTLKAFSIANGVLSTQPISQTPQVFGYPGPSPSVSSNGTSSGIVWAIQTDGYSTPAPAILHAYDASDLANELYNSSQYADRDQLGYPCKFTAPTVANGKVYVPEQYGVAVLGLGKWAAAPVVTPPGATAAKSITVKISDATQGASIYYTLDGSSPTQQSARFTGAITLTSSATLSARAFAPGYSPSPMTVDYFLIGVKPGKGTGLLGHYYQNDNLAGPDVEQLDSTLNFNWGGAAPVAGVAGDDWSGMWTGSIVAQSTAAYTFGSVSDDGVRVWVAGQEIINDWTYHAPTWDTGTINLEAGKKVPIKVQYFQGGGGSELQLYWSALGVPWQVVPETQLFPSAVARPQITPPGGTFNSTVTVSLMDGTPGSAIHYTTDGSTPTGASPVYSGPFVLAGTTTVRANATLTGSPRSAESTASFALDTSPPALQINCGGSAAPPFGGDADFSGGSTYAAAGTVDTGSVTDPAPQAVYLSMRWGQMSYTLTGLSAGASYRVRLHFAETYWGSAGQRVFNVSINGKAALTNFDVVAAVGANFKAVVKEFDVRAQSDGSIAVAFNPVTDQPMVSGIEVIPK